MNHTITLKVAVPVVGKVTDLERISEEELQELWGSRAIRPEGYNHPPFFFLRTRSRAHVFIGHATISHAADAAATVRQMFGLPAVVHTRPLAVVESKREESEAEEAVQLRLRLSL